MSDLNREKRAEIIQDALEYLDDDMIENVDKLRMGTKAPGGKARITTNFFAYNTRYLTVAASVCLLIIGAFAWGNVIGPSNYQDAPMGTESAGGNHRVPENAPEMEGDLVDGTEHNPVDSEGDSDCIIVDTELITIPDDSMQGEQKPGETPNEPDYYPPMGDVYQLTDNYAKVTILPNKVWSYEATLEDNYAKSKEIEEKYYEIIDKFIEALCATPLLKTDIVMDAGNSVGDTDVYHLFFQKTNGEIVQVCIFADYGFVYFYDNSEYCMKIDGDILYEVLKVLWVHW